MNFKKIFYLQKKLDKLIIETHKVNNQQIRTKRLVAILVEVAEVANEYAPFKYWKKNIEINKDKLMEEFADGIHFFASIALELECSENIEAKIVSQSKSNQLMATFHSICKLSSNYSKEQFLTAFGIYLGNAKLINISDEDLEDAYVKKNILNHKRLKNNY